MKIKSVNENMIDLMLDKRIDSNNAADFLQSAKQLMEPYKGMHFRFDAKELEYISSSGLRMILTLRKSFVLEEIYNASKRIYEIMEMVGFTDIVKIEKDVEQLSEIEDEELGRDYFGIVYRKDEENVVKVFHSIVDLDLVKKSDRYARLALKYEIPTAFMYEPAKDGNRLASVFSAEKNAVTLAKARKAKPQKEERYFNLFSSLLRNLHNNLILKETPMILSDLYIDMIQKAKQIRPELEWDRLIPIINSLPDSEMLILRELSEENVLVESHGLYLLDMCGLVMGSPLWELTGIYVNMQDNEGIGMAEPTCYRAFLKTYILSDEEEILEAYCKVIRVLEPIQRLMRVLECNEPLNDEIVHRIQTEIIDSYENIKNCIGNLREIFDVTSETEVDFSNAFNQDGVAYISLDRTGRNLLALPDKSEAPMFAVKKQGDGTLVICEIYGELKINGKMLAPQECPVQGTEHDRFYLNGVYFFIDYNKMLYSVLKSRQEKLQIEIRKRTARRRLRTKTLLKNINLSLYPGEMILLIGSSGAGKTTFMNAVTGYEKADALIRKNTIDFYKDYEQIKHQIGFAPQQDVLRNEDLVYYTLKNAADLRLPNGLSKEDVEARIEEVLEIFGLTDLKMERVGALSGGQRKRLSIAVEFIADPILFFLDEPDSGLDGVMARALMEDLRKITGDNRIVVVISHSPDRVIDLFDKVIVLTKSEEDGAGHLAFYGTITAARKFFERDKMEEILKLVNRTSEGGEGKGQFYIDKFREML